MTRLLIKRFVKDEKRESYSYLSGFVGIVCNVLLCVIKFVIGAVTNSLSITADAMNNLADASSNIFTIAGARLASKPVDDEHPFGHGRMEYISALVVSFLIFLMSFELGKSSVDKIINPQDTKFSIVSLIILIIAVLAKLWMGFFNNKLYKMSDNINLKAVMKDCLNDCISTFATIIALVVSYFTEFKMIDGIIGIGVAIIIFFAGVDIVKDVIGLLLGKPPEKELVDSIEQIVMAKEEIIGIHDLIVHDYGPGRIIASVHAEVPCDIDILKIHDVIDNVEQEIAAKLNIIICIHMDPVVTNDKTVEKYKGLVAEIIKEYNEEFAFHDFRMVQGETHTNVIFDLVVPHSFANEKNKIAKDVKALINKKQSDLFAVITVEHKYV